MIPMSKITEAYARMLKSDVKYRLVIDMASLRSVRGEKQSAKTSQDRFNPLELQ
jgi:hypothetical protein